LTARRWDRLLGLARTEHPDSGRRRGWDTDDVLADGDELLGQEEPKPVGATAVCVALWESTPMSTIVFLPL